MSLRLLLPFVLLFCCFICSSLTYILDCNKSLEKKKFPPDVCSIQRRGFRKEHLIAGYRVLRKRDDIPLFSFNLSYFRSILLSLVCRFGTFSLILLFGIFYFELMYIFLYIQIFVSIALDSFAFLVLSIKFPSNAFAIV